MSAGAGLAALPRLALNALRPNPGAHKAARRVGRGPGSGRGKTCGRGHKGQRARQGGSVRHGFEGGQTPLQKRLPKRGRSMAGVSPDPFSTVHLHDIQRKIDIGALDPAQPITLKRMWNVGLVSRVAGTSGVKVLLEGGPRDVRISPGLRLEVSRASKGVAQALLSTGGSLRLVYYNARGLRAHAMPHKFKANNAPLPRWARPAPRLQAFYNQGWSPNDDTAPSNDSPPPHRDVATPEDVILKNHLPRASYMLQRHRERQSIRKGNYGARD